MKFSAVFGFLLPLCRPVCHLAGFLPNERVNVHWLGSGRVYRRRFALFAIAVEYQEWRRLNKRP